MSSQTTSDLREAANGHETGHPSSAEVEFASELRIAVGRLMRRFRSTYSFPLAQASVLGRLERDGDQCIGELASAERVRPQSMSQTLGELEALSLIQRSADETDGRRTKIGLTDEGREAIARERAVRDGWLAETIAAFTPEQRQVLAQAVPLLESLAGS